MKKATIPMLVNADKVTIQEQPAYFESESTPSQCMIYSMPHANDVKKCIQDLYPIEKIKKCYLLNRGRNDVYLLKSVDDRKYIARIGNQGFCISSNLDYELAFIEHLRSCGAPVVTFVKTRNEQRWTTARFAGRERSIVLFDYLRGDAVSGNSSVDAYNVGRTIGRIHQAGRSYAGPSSRHVIDAAYLIKQPVKAISTCEIIDKKHKPFIQELSERTAARLADIEDRLSFGRCHGDCHHSNALVIDKASVNREIVFFDFECSGPGWPIYDLATSFLSRSSDAWRRHYWPSFLEGYGEAHSLTQADHNALSLFTMIRRLWSFGVLVSVVDEFGAHLCSSKKVKKIIRGLASLELRHAEDSLV